LKNRLNQRINSSLTNGSTTSKSSRNKKKALPLWLKSERPKLKSPEKPLHKELSKLKKRRRYRLKRKMTPLDS